MNKDSKIFIAGHRGLVGSAILKNLTAKGYTNTVIRTHSELDLTDTAAVADFFKEENRNMYFWQQLKWEALLRITRIVQILSMLI